MFHVDMSVVAENICRFLRSKEIQLSPNNNWLNNCIDWFKSHLELVNIYGSLEEYVWIQWALADLQDVKCGSLPSSCRDEIVDLPGRYHVQINWLRNIGQSCYTQLQTIQNENHAESNDNLTTDEQRKENWEPSPKRVLLMEVTDGVITLKAMEYSPISKLTEPFLPGLKAVLSGPIECRKGILFLKNNNIDLLGGEVNFLYHLNCKEVLLSRCLNIVTNDEVIEEREKNCVTHHHTKSNTHDVNRTRLSSSLEEVAGSASVNDCNTFVQERGMLMADEDDDFLCQLPDEVLQCENKLEPEDNKHSHNILKVPSVQATSSKYGTEQSTPLSYGSLIMNQSKWFSCREDFTAVEREVIPSTSRLTNDLPCKADIHPSSEDLNHLSSTTQANLSVSTVNKLLGEIQAKPINKSIENLLNLNNSFATGTLEKQKSLGFKHHNKDTDVQKTNEDSIDSVFNTNRSKFPSLKVVEIKIESITKLKIRSGEWFCCATAVCEEQSLDVTFSNKVLEQLFGISATEVEIWRGEMTTNPSLKKKVNDILKRGQTKLKTLNCPMTLEYFLEHDTPQVTDIHVL